MTEAVEAKKSLKDEFKALSPKQWISIVLGFAVSAILMVTGMFVSMCLGFFIVAILLYMIPHITGVKDPRIKAVIGAVFIAFLLIVVATCYGNSAKDQEWARSGNVYITDAYYEDGVLTIECTEDMDFTDGVFYTKITGMIFGQPYTYDKENLTYVTMERTETGYTGNVPLKDGYYYYIEVAGTVGEQKDGYQILVNTGISAGDTTSLNINGSWLIILEIALIYFLLLIFAALMRRSAEKTRAKMEQQGRLYPAGYDKCKNCGTLILPGEIVCRKCGAAIEVPEEIKVLHKKDFFECSECGTEVPMDAKYCPKCGAVFDEEDEAEIKHADGTVDTSTKTFVCSKCGEEVPANAKRCPYCGTEFENEE